MVSKQDFQKVAEYVWEVPVGFRQDMRVPARIYADEALLEDALGDQSIEQLINTATLPGVVRHALVMPDCHQGYGFPIGGVTATELGSGVISPGGVGYDINCGMRLMGTHLQREEIEPHIQSLATALYQNCPSGLGEKGSIPLSAGELDEVCVKGSRWALDKGYARRDDLPRTEEHGCMPGADPAHVSKRARERGKSQVGTLGSGNHFIEIDHVVEIYDEQAAQAMGLFPGQVAAQIHCGSRGLGHQICTDYVADLQEAVRKYKLALPDRELVCAPFDSPEGRAYFAAMICAANYAFANRQVLMYHIRRTFEQVLAGKVSDWDVFQVYDIAHNIAKVETHSVEGKKVKVCVHRKGATRAFGPGFEELPPEYREVGQPVLIPGSMGTCSWVMVGTQHAMDNTFGSSCHGAGRVMSRAQAKKRVRGDKLKSELEHQGIAIRTGSMPGLAEEAPLAYKDVDAVVQVMHQTGVARKVARLEPLIVVKG